MDVDFILIRKMKQGDDEAFDSFVRKYYGDILKYCAYHCPDTEDARDLTQETFVRFFTRLSDYHWQGKTRNYLYTIAGNLCKNYFAKKKAEPSDDEFLAANSPPVPGPEGAVTDRVALLWALDQLPQEYREVIDLFYFQELKLTEIARCLKIGLPLVKYRLRQAKAGLQEILKEDGDDGSGRTDS